MEIIQVQSHVGEDVALAQRLAVVEKHAGGLALRRFAPTLYHGTPVPPEQMGDTILPFQAQCYKGGKYVDHGAIPAVSASTTLDFPYVRSLVHKDHHVFAQHGSDPFIARKANAIGAAHVFVTSGVIEALTENDSHGYVYGAERPPTDLKDNLHQALPW